MENALKCPFCGTRLRSLFNKYTAEPNYDFECGNYGCDLYGIEMPETVWKSLIQTKQDLVIAKSTLEYLGYEFPPAYPEKNVISEMRQKARNAVKYIEHKEQRNGKSN